MRQPSHELLKYDLLTLKGALGRMEAAMLGFRFTGDTAEEIRSLADRLKGLTVPMLGTDAVELDRAA